MKMPKSVRPRPQKMGWWMGNKSESSDSLSGPEGGIPSKGLGFGLSDQGSKWPNQNYLQPMSLFYEWSTAFEILMK